MKKQVHKKQEDTFGNCFNPHFMLWTFCMTRLNRKCIRTVPLSRTFNYGPVYYVPFSHLKRKYCNVQFKVVTSGLEVHLGTIYKTLGDFESNAENISFPTYLAYVQSCEVNYDGKTALSFFSSKHKTVESVEFSQCHNF